MNDQQDRAVETYGRKGKLGVQAVRPFVKDPVDQGCRSAPFAATTDDIGKRNLDGVYFSHCLQSHRLCQKCTGPRAARKLSETDRNRVGGMTR